jgi:hypothetical protein
MPPQEPSDARRYESKYSPGVYVTAAQWLAEHMCERQARAKGQDLPPHFWKAPSHKATWEKAFLRQFRAAHALLRQFPEKAVGQALRTPAGRRVVSLAAPSLLDLVKAAARELELQERLAAEAPPPPPQGPPPRTFRTGGAFRSKKSVWEKLKEVDGEG